MVIFTIRKLKGQSAKTVRCASGEPKSNRNGENTVLVKVLSDVKCYKLDTIYEISVKTTLKTKIVIEIEYVKHTQKVLTRDASTLALRNNAFLKVDC